MICYSLGQSELESFKQEVTTLSGKLKKAENDLHQKNKEIADLKKGESKKLQSIRRENVSLKKQVLAPGKSTKMYISVNAKYLRSNAKRTPRVLMITNDPKHPKNEITIKVKK